MLYLLRPPENSSGPQPRAREAERSGAKRKETCSTFLSFLFLFFLSFFFFNVMIHFSSYFSSVSSSLPAFSLFFDHFRPVTCFSCGGAVCERTTPHAGERLVQQRKRKKKKMKPRADFVALLRFSCCFFHFFFLQEGHALSSQSFRHYYKLQGFESSVRRSGFSFFFFFFFKFCCGGWDSCDIPTQDIS